ncbi:MAG: glutaminyl-peptide cyclotransferase [Anaerolineae bacterium]|nr:glutaminyl-peptide cyclotransferase [Anaerolineae bacterium]
MAQSDNPLFAEVEILKPEIISVRDHDASAYTQGLLLYEGSIYESTGRNGESTLREVDPATGKVLRSIDVPEEYFAEGLALVGDSLIQLTWKAQVAFIYDRATFEQTGTFAYEGEGWGLCYDGQYLYMSNGSPFLTVRDPETFDVIFSGLVTAQGSIVDNLNELECVGDYVYANVYQTNYIVRIDKTNGVVTAIIDAADLVPADERDASWTTADVLNGIVYLPDSDTFLITGKYWPKMYEVIFVPVE